MYKILIAIFVTYTTFTYASELHEAIRAEKSLQSIDQSAFDKINELDEHGLSSLFYAVVNRSEAAIQTLLQRGAKTEIAQQARSPLWAAVVHGDIATIDSLIKHQAVAKEISSKGYSPIGAAIMSGRVKVLEHMAPNCDSAFLLEHFSSEMKARTNEDPMPLREEGMNTGAAVRDAIRARHTSMALFLLNKGVPLVPDQGYPGGYAADCPFCLFEGIYHRSITPALAMALIKAGENPYARVTSVSNINRSAMMPTSAMEAAALFGNAELLECLIKNAKPKEDDFLGNLYPFGSSNVQPGVSKLVSEHFKKFHKEAYTCPPVPNKYRREIGTLRAFATRLRPVADAPTEIFDGRDEKTSISFYATLDAKIYLKPIFETLSEQEIWQLVKSDEIDRGLDEDYWDKDDIDAGELGKATGARVICVLEIMKDKENYQTLVCHLISSSSGVCFESIQIPIRLLGQYDLALEITNAWRNWKERCTMMSGKFHAIVFEEAEEANEDTKALGTAIDIVPQWIVLTKKQSEILQKSEFIKSRSTIKSKHIPSQNRKNTITLALRDSSGTTIETTLETTGKIDQFMIKSALAEIASKSKSLNDIDPSILQQYRERMRASGYNESALFLARMLQWMHPTSGKHLSFCREDVGKSLVPFIHYVTGMSGMRNIYYPAVLSYNLQRTQIYHPLMMEYANLLNEEIKLAWKTSKQVSDSMKPVSVGHLLRLLAHYRFFLRPSFNPEYMDQMDSAIAQLIDTASQCYTSDAERLQLCIGVVGANSQCINRFDLHRCKPLRDFLVSEMMRLSKLGTNKSKDKLPIDYFDHRMIGSCFHRILEASCTPQAKGSWDKELGGSFEKLISVANGDRIMLDKEFFYAGESVRPVLAQKICEQQCSAIRSDKVTFLTGVSFFDLARYVPMQLSAPKLFDAEWRKHIVPHALKQEKCNGEITWSLSAYHAEAALSSSQARLVNTQKTNFKQIPGNLRNEVYLSCTGSDTSISNIEKQSKMVYDLAQAKFGKEKNIPDITAPNSLLLDKKISLLDDDGKSDVSLPIGYHFDATSQILYFSCVKTAGSSTINMSDRDGFDIKAEIVSVDLKNGKILRMEHPEYKTDVRDITQDSQGHIVGSQGKSMIWVMSNSTVLQFNKENLKLSPLKLKIPMLEQLGSSHAFVNDVCFIQTRENEAKDGRSFQYRGKVTGISADGNVFTVIDTRRSPAVSDFDQPANLLNGLYAEGDKLHLFTNQSATYRQVNPMHGTFSPDGKMLEVDKDSTTVTNARNKFVMTRYPDSKKSKLDVKNHVFHRGLPGRFVIHNRRGMNFAIPMEFAGFKDHKMTMRYPISTDNSTFERYDEMPIQDFVKTVFIRPEIVGETQDHFYVCAAFRDTGYLPYVWRVDKKLLLNL